MAVTQTFAIEAQKKLGGGDASEAVRMLEEGIKQYPDYTTAYAVLARAYMQMNDTESAFETVQLGLRRFPSHRALLMLDADLRPHALKSNPSAITQKPLTKLEVSDQKSSVQETTAGTPQAGVPKSHSVAPEPEVGNDRVVKANTSATALSEGLGVMVASRPTHTVQPDEADVKLDDGLSNIDDDNDNWPELIELVDEDAEKADVDEELTDALQNSQTSLTINDADDAHVLIQNMNVVDGSVIVNNSVLKRIRRGSDAMQLRLVATASSASGRNRTLKSSNMRLIPGLEFTPLRVQSMRKQHIRTHNLPEAPAFPVIRGSQMNISPTIAPPTAKEVARRKKQEGEKKQRHSETKRTHLEELAARLEQARIPVITEEPELGAKHTVVDSSEPTLVSETMATIYAQQGLREQAIKAYRQLARQKPEKLEYFEQKIADLTPTDDV